MLGELELAWRLLPNEFVAVTGTNGKTTTVELLGHIHREAGLPVAVAGNVGTAARARWSASSTRARRSSARRRPSSSRTRSRSRPRRRCCSTSTPDHLDRHGTLEAYRAAKLQRLRPPGHRRRRGRAARPRRRATAAAARGACRFGDAPAPTLRRPRRASSWWRGEPLLAADEIRLRGAHNRENAMAAAAVCAGARPRARRGARRRCARFARRRAPARGGRERRRRALRQRLQGDQRRLDAASRSRVVRRAAGPPDPRRAGQGRRTSRRCASRSPSAARGVYLIGEDAAEIAAALAPPACRCTTAATSSARSPRRAPPRARARSCCSRPPARASTSSPTSRRAASTSARWSRR